MWWMFGCEWVYVNIDSKTVQRGKLGVSLTKEIGHHTITPAEFKTIYGIYKKYDGLSPLTFHRCRTDKKKDVGYMAPQYYHAIPVVSGECKELSRINDMLDKYSYELGGYEMAYTG